MRISDESTRLSNNSCGEVIVFACECRPLTCFGARKLIESFIRCTVLVTGAVTAQRCTFDDAKSYEARLKQALLSRKSINYRSWHRDVQKRSVPTGLRRRL